jgi:hypothetical protein
MSLRIIDNKRLDLTDSEWQLYQNICKSYDRSNFKGSDLFTDLFETDNNGVIIFLKPPTSRYSSMEVYMFLVTVMIHQHLGVACGHVDRLSNKLDEKINEADQVIGQVKKIIKELERSRG